MNANERSAILDDRDAVSTGDTDPKNMDFEGPAFILCTARSGSTLLRSIIDAHKAFACPPETNLSQVLLALSHTSAAVSDTMAEGVELMRECAQALSDLTLGAYAKGRDKVHWVDKSLTTVGHLHFVREAFPNARYISLFRQCADVAASAVEASPWGFGGYGFTPYVANTPGNVLIGLFNYWADYTTKQLMLEAELPDRCHRIRYEDIVRAPEATLGALFDFLGEPWEPTADDIAALLGKTSSRGPGDYKIVFTDRLSDDSIGRGANLPFQTIPTPILDQVDNLLGKLGYEPIPRQGTVGTSKRQPEPDAAGSATRAETAALRSVIEATIRENLARVAEGPGEAGERKANLCLTGIRGTYSIDLNRRSMEATDDPSAEMWTIVIDDLDVIAGIAAREVNPGVALRRNDIRLLAPTVSEVPLVSLEPYPFLVLLVPSIGDPPERST